MKIITFFLIFLSVSSFAIENDILITQRDASNVSQTRIIQDPGQHAIFVYNNTSNRPAYATIGTGLTYSAGVLSSNTPQIQTDWNATTGLGVILNKPSWPASFDGSYNSLTNKPVIFNGTWGSLTGKPDNFIPSYHTHTTFDISDSSIVGRYLMTAPDYAWLRGVLQDETWEWMDDVVLAGGISPVGLSNDYNDLDNLPTIPGSLFSGEYGDLTGIPSAFTPAAHNQAWSTITSTPTTVSGYGITDAEPTISSGTTAQYWRGDKTWATFPAIPTQTSQLTNNSGYATGSYVDSQVATKLTIPAGTTSQVVLGNGTLGTLPVAQAIQRIRVQTDINGNYTWTYPVAYGSGVVPIISAVSESASSTVPQGVQIVGTPTNTSATFKVINLPSTSVLSIVVLGAPAGSQAYIHITAVAP